MKKIPLILLLLLAVLTAAAQENSLLTRKKKQERLKAKAIDYRHDFRIGVGVPAVMFENVKFFGQCKGYAPHEVQTQTHYSPTFAFYYSYRVIKGLKIGGTLAYYHTQTWDAVSDPNYRVLNTHNYNTWNVSFDVRYEWFNRGVVTMYSDISASLKFEHRINGGTDPIPRAGVTPLGITIGGKQLFGYVELFSFGPRGFFNGGIGYRF